MTRGALPPLQRPGTELGHVWLEEFKKEDIALHVPAQHHTTCTWSIDYGHNQFFFAIIINILDLIIGNVTNYLLGLPIDHDVLAIPDKTIDLSRCECFCLFKNILMMGRYSC